MKENRKVYEQVLSDDAGHYFTFFYKSFFSHFFDLIKIVVRKLPKLAAIFASTWAIAQIIFLDDKTQLQRNMVPAVVIAVVIVLYESVVQYWCTVSDQLKKEPREIQRAWFHKKVGWQYALTFALLENRLQEKELALVRVRQNAEFIFPNILAETELVEFIKTQPHKLLRLIASVKACCVHYLPNAVKNVKNGSELELKLLLSEIENLVQLYQYAIDHERIIQSVQPPEKYENLIGYMKGWTDPLRDGIDQMVGFFEKLSKIRKRDVKNMGESKLEFDIVFGPPENMEMFNSEIENLSRGML